LSSDHESGQRLDALGGIAAILTYPIYDLDEDDDGSLVKEVPRPFPPSARSSLRSSHMERGSYHESLRSPASQTNMRHDHGPFLSESQATVEAYRDSHSISPDSRLSGTSLKNNNQPSWQRGAGYEH